MVYCMLLVTSAIVPTLLLLGAGALLRYRFLADPGFWRGLEWVSYRVFTPALFITSIAGTNLTIVPLGPLLLSLAIPIVVVAGLVIALQRPLRANGPQLTSLMQGAVRINTYIGLAFATVLHGREGVATFALASAMVVPLVNVICVCTLAAYGDKTTSFRRLPIWRDFLENPLIQSCVAGLAMNLAGLTLPDFLSGTLTTLASPALACGTLIAGGALHFRLRGRDAIDVTLVAALKLVVLPIAAAAIAIPLGLAGATLSSVVLICAIPTAPSAYILANRMGGDTRLMASITGTQTIFAAGTVPWILALVNHWTV